MKLQGAVSAQVHRDLAVPSTHTRTHTTPPPLPLHTPLQSCWSRAWRCPRLWALVPTPPSPLPLERLGTRLSGVSEARCLGQSPQPHGLGQGSLNRKGWQLHTPALNVTEAGCVQDAAIIHSTRRASSHPAALSLADMEPDSRKNFLTTLEPGFRWVRAFQMMEGTTSEAKWAVSWGECLCYCSWEERKQPSWVGALNPRPLPGCHKLPPSTRSSAAWPGTAGAGGVVGGSFQLHLCLGKIPFHVAACDLSRRLCRRGASSGEQGEVLQPRAPSPPAQGKRQHLQKLLGTGRVLLRGVGMGSLASRGHPGRRPQPAPAWLLAVHGPQMASASPRWHAYRCGVDGSGASPKGGMP